MFTKVFKTLCLFFVWLELIALCGCEMNNDTEINIDDLSIRQGSSQCRTIDFDEAVKLKVELTGSGSETEEPDSQLFSEAEAELSEIEEKAKEDSEQVVYYEFTGDFLIPEIEGLYGTMTTLIIVVNGKETTSHASRYIQFVEPPLTKMASHTEVFSWTHGKSSVDIDMYQESALLSAVGYVVALIPKDGATIQYSNNLHLDFELSVDMLEY